MALFLRGLSRGRRRRGRALRWRRRGATLAAGDTQFVGNSAAQASVSIAARSCRQAGASRAGRGSTARAIDHPRPELSTLGRGVILHAAGFSL